MTAASGAATLKPSANEATRESFLAAHSRPAVNLGTETWLPVVTTSGDIEVLSLGEALIRSHQLRDIAVTDPVARAAARRWLTALTARLVTLSAAGSDRPAWTHAANGNRGFTDTDVAALLQDQQPHLWLYHPASPFLQDLRLAASKVFRDSMVTSSDELIPHSPGRDASAWSLKPGETGYHDGLNVQVLPFALLRRWYYGLRGNGGGGDKGGAFSAGTANAPLTQVFRVSPRSLFVTLLRNLTPAVVAATKAPITGLAWTDPDPPHADGDGLYRYSVTATGVLLDAPDGQGLVRRVLRATTKNTTTEDKSTVKMARDQAVAADPHIIYTPPAKTGDDPKQVRLYDIDPPLRRVEQMRRRIIDNHQVTATGVVNNTDLWLPTVRDRDDETIEILHATFSGNASSMKWSSAATLTLPAAHLDPQWSRDPDLETLLAVTFGPDGIHRHLRWAIRTVVPGPITPTVSSLLRSVEHRWLTDADTIASNALAGTTSVEDAIPALWRSASSAASTVLRPYSLQPRYAGLVIQALNRLTPRRQEQP